MIKVVILLVIVITYPFITAIVYIGTRFISVPVSYLAGGMVGNLYVPLIVILVGVLLFIAIKFIYLNLYINKKLLDVEVKRPNLTFKEILVILCLVVAGIGLVFHSLTMEWKLIQDIPHLAHSDFAVAEGELTLYEISHGDTSETRMMIDGIKMDGGFEDGEQLVDHAKYYVEYLPHSKYVVRYHRISSDLKKI